MLHSDANRGSPAHLGLRRAHVGRRIAVPLAGHRLLDHRDSGNSVSLPGHGPAGACSAASAQLVEGLHYCAGGPTRSISGNWTAA